MSDFFVYAIGAALVDTEIAVTDADLDHLGVEKGMMTLVDENRQTEIKTFLNDRLAAATHACGGSAGNSMIAASQFGAPSYMSCLVANDADGDIYVRDLEQCGVAHGFANGRATKMRLRVLGKYDGVFVPQFCEAVVPPGKKEKRIHKSVSKRGTAIWGWG